MERARFRFAAAPLPLLVLLSSIVPLLLAPAEAARRAVVRNDNIWGDEVEFPPLPEDVGKYANVTLWMHGLDTCGTTCDGQDWTAVRDLYGVCWK